MRSRRENAIKRTAVAGEDKLRFERRASVPAQQLLRRIIDDAAAAIEADPVARPIARSLEEIAVIRDRKRVERQQVIAAAHTDPRIIRAEENAAGPLGNALAHFLDECEKRSILCGEPLVAPRLSGQRRHRLRLDTAEICEPAQIQRDPAREDDDQGPAGNNRPRRSALPYEPCGESEQRHESDEQRERKRLVLAAEKDDVDRLIVPGLEAEP